MKNLVIINKNLENQNKTDVSQQDLIGGVAGGNSIIE